MAVSYVIYERKETSKGHSELRLYETRISPKALWAFGVLYGALIALLVML